MSERASRVSSFRDQNGCHSWCRRCTEISVELNPIVEELRNISCFQKAQSQKTHIRDLPTRKCVHL
jgi:hypothetical protein